MKSLATCLILAAALALLASTVRAAEISLYDFAGKATVYIADNQTIYTWEGKPVAYLSSGSVYGFNGKHLGWFSQGSVMDHAGNTTCAVREALGVVAPYAEYAKYAKYSEYSKYSQAPEPPKPPTTQSWSDTPCKVFMKMGV